MFCPCEAYFRVVCPLSPAPPRLLVSITIGSKGRTEREDKGGEVDRRRRTQEQIDKERMDARWKFGKVREEMCLVHEAFQFFRQKFRTKYGNYNPGPNVFLR